MVDKANEAENQEVEAEEIEVEIPDVDTPDEAPIAPEPADKPAKPEPKRQDVEPAKEAPPAPKTAQAHDDEDDDTSLSEKVRKRIGKLTYQKRQMEREAAEYRERYEALSREREDERRKYETQRANSDDLIISAREDALNGKLYQARQEYEAAYNQGLIQEQMDAHAKITELIYSKRELELVKERRKAAKEAPPPRQEAPQQASGGYTPEEMKRYMSSAAELSTNYIAQYQNWWDKDEVLTSAVLGIDKKLKSEGDLKPWEPAFYEELDKRLRKRFPTEFAEAHADVAEDAPNTPAPMVQRPSQPVAGVSRGTGRGTVKVRLSPEDIAYCEKWQIDQSRYAKEKHALEGKTR